MQVGVHQDILDLWKYGHSTLEGTIVKYSVDKSYIYFRFELSKIIEGSKVDTISH